MRRSVIMAWLVCWSQTAFAGSPTIRELRPWGAQRGQSIAITIVGDQLEAGAEPFSAVPGTLTEQPGGNAGQLSFQLEIKPDAPIGVYPIRVRTSGGLSNVLLFTVGDLPELVEAEPNNMLPANSAGAAAAEWQHLALPATVNGSSPGTDQDLFRFAARKGDRVVLEVEAQRIGSPLDPAIHLFDSSGRELAMRDDTPGLGLDCRLDLAVPADGDYFASVHDSKFTGAGPAYYRLKIGSFAYADSAFPLGGRRGSQWDVTLFGGTLAEPVTTSVAPNALNESSHFFIPIPTPGPNSQLPFRLALGDEPESIEPDSDALDRRTFESGVMNGRIGKQGEIDRYRFPAAPGQTWLIEVEAANLGSPLDALLSIMNPQGAPLAVADDGNGLDPRLQVAVPDGVDHLVISVEDLHRRGGSLFAYRLKARKPRAEFRLEVVALNEAAVPPPGTQAPIGPTAINIPRGGLALVQVNVLRDGYNGPIQLEIPETAAGITAEDGYIAAGANSGLLAVYAAGDLPLRAFDLEIRGQGGEPTKPLIRPAAARRPHITLADAVQARVPAAICERPPVSFNIADRTIKLVHGHGRSIKLVATRGQNAQEPINITGTGLPAFIVSGTAGAIPKDANELTLALNCSPENPVVGPFTLQLQAVTQVAGRAETVQLPPVKVEIVRPFSLELLNPAVTVAAGSSIRVSALIRRESPFDGLVRVGPAGSLPQHVALTTVDVSKGDGLALLELRVDDSATPADLEIPIRASTDMEGRKRDKDYVIPDNTLRVKITPKVPPQ